MGKWSPRLERLIAEGQVKPPKREGPLPEPLKMDLPSGALLRALDETREERSLFDGDGSE